MKLNLPVFFILLWAIGGIAIASDDARAVAHREDLVTLAQTMQRDRSFSPAARARFEDAVADLKRRAAELDDADFELGVASAVALADNGHTSARSATRGQRLNALPLRFVWLSDGLFVVKAESSLRDLLGARVMTEAGQSPEKLVEALRPYIGGPPNLARTLTPYLLQSPAALHAAKLAPSATAIAFTFELRDGRTLERTVVAETKPAVPDQRSDWPYRALSPVPIPGDAAHWVHVLDEKKSLPLYLQNPERPYWDAPLAEFQAIYVQINTTRSQGALALDAFLEGVLERVRSAHPENAIVDLRFNAGGNYQLTAHFTETLPKLLPKEGRVFILTSGNTFSAAIITVARLKYFAGSRGLIVGEQIGDRAQFWGEGEVVVLPNSKIPVRFADGYHDWEYGPNSAVTQHTANARYGVAAGNLAPTLEAPFNFVDYLAGRDPALEAIRALLVH